MPFVDALKDYLTRRGAVPPDPDAIPRGSVRCIEHTGRRCLSCYEDGRSLGYSSAPTDRPGWMVRARRAEHLRQRTLTGRDQLRFAEECAHAWVEASLLAPRGVRSDDLDQAVLAFLRADKIGEAQGLIEWCRDDLSAMALELCGPPGLEVLRRRDLALWKAHQDRKAARLAPTAHVLRAP